MKDGQMSGYFDTKYMSMPQIEQILHNIQFSRDSHHMSMLFAY